MIASKEGAQEMNTTKSEMTSGTGGKDIIMVDTRTALSTEDTVFVQRGRRELSGPRGMKEQKDQRGRSVLRDLKGVRGALMRIGQITRIVKNIRTTRVEIWQRPALVSLELRWV
jgi:hypothetical protein